MRPEPLPIAARPLARHADVLLRRCVAGGGNTTGAAADPLAAGLSAISRQIARMLASGLARLLGGEAPTVTGATPGIAAVADLSTIAGPLAGNSLFAQGDARFVASIDAAALLRMLDRTFGGRGDVPDPLPTVLPLSAQLLLERIEAVIADATAAAGERPGAAAPRAVQRDGDLAQVMPFAAGDALRLFGFDIIEPGGERWRLTLAFAEAAVGAFFGIGEAPAPRATAADPSSAPFGDMPLPLTARLVDMAMPLARLARLRVGDVLPVAVARNVPLHLGGKAIARGSIGAFDDRVAVQLTEAFR